MKNRSGSGSRRGFWPCLALVALSGSSCDGTETDNPITSLPDVFDGSSPERFLPPRDIPGCPPPLEEDLANVPRGPAQPVAVATANGAVLATGAYAGGLSLYDASDPERPVLVSSGVVRGEIHQLLVASSGELWVAATEPPLVEGREVPEASALDPQLRLIRLDVSDPAQPVRVVEVALEGEFWEVRERDGALWALTARRAPGERGCSAPPEELGCGYRSYEALTLRGFASSGAAVESLGDAELPFERRAWWGPDGVAAALADGAMHVVAWDGSGALLPARSVRLESDALAGPADVVEGELSVVSVASGELRLDVHDVATGAPLRSFGLGPRAERAGMHSLFALQHLWLQAAERAGAAELWRLAGDAPVRVALPRPFFAVLPIVGAVREGGGEEILALGFERDASTGSERASLLSIRGVEVTVLDAPGLDVRFGSSGGGAAPAGIVGAGDASAWQLSLRGPGLPFGIHPPGPPTEVAFTIGFVGVDTDGVLSEGAAATAVTAVGLVESYASSGEPPVTRRVTALEITRDGAESRIELSVQTHALVPTRSGVVAVATTPRSQCEQSGADCSGYAPGVSVFDLSGEPRLVAELPFPELPLAGTPPNLVSVSWDIYDALTRTQRAALELGDDRLAFVAQVDLSCDTEERCDALGITAVPIREANVVAGAIADCPPSDVDPDCVPMPAMAPTVYGTGQRQYFFVLALAAPGGPSWQPWGVSRLEATVARTDRNSRFAAPIATNGVLAATRLERRSSATDPRDRGVVRFYLDRFERAASGEIVALPPVNIPGYPLAHLGGDPTFERWLSVEAAPGETGRARLYRLNLQSDGARVEQQLDLDGRFTDARVLSPSADEPVGLVLLTPEDGCGTSELSAIRLGSGDANDALEIAASLEFPSDDWAIAAVDRNLALLRRDYVYVLVEVADSLRVVASRSVDVSLTSEQLLGTHLFGSAGPLGHRILDLSLVP